MNFDNERGFTLVEMLITLVIVIVIVMITVINLKPYSETLNKTLFTRRLSNDLFYGQLYAIANQTTVHVNFMPANKRYYLRHGPNNLIVNRQLPNHITFVEGSQSMLFNFLANGNISNFGSFSFKVNDNKTRLVFQLGKGRFYFE